MKKETFKNKILNIIIASLLIVAIIFCSTITTFALEYQEIGNENAKAPNVYAKSAILYSLDLEEVMYSKHPNLKCEPYSVTKLMTAYLAVDNLELDQKVRISKKAANDAPDGSTMFLHPGEIVTVKELLYGALLTSGNDAAYALAEAVSGNMKDFAELMNKTADKWGCTKTHFVNPNGYKAKGHYTTANDLLIIAKHALGDETVRKIAFTKKYNMRATNKNMKRILLNHTIPKNNKRSGILGGKTGYWSTQDCSVVLQYNKKELSALLILLGDTELGREIDTKYLLRYAHKVTPGYKVCKDGDIVGTVWVKHGAKTRVKTVVSGDANAYPKRQSKLRIRVKKEYNKKITAPLKQGDKLGTLRVFVSGNEVASRDILAADSVAVGWFPSWIYISNTAVICFVLLIILLVALIMILRTINKSRRRNRNIH